MEIDKNLIDYFLNRSSIVGLLTIYFCKLMFDQKKAFHKSDLEKVRVGEYCYGYLVAASACGLIDLTVNEAIINIIAYNEYLASKIYQHTKNMCETLDKQNNNTIWINELNKLSKL